MAKDCDSLFRGCITLFFLIEKENTSFISNWYHLQNLVQIITGSCIAFYLW